MKHPCALTSYTKHAHTQTHQGPLSHLEAQLSKRLTLPVPINPNGSKDQCEDNKNGVVGGRLGERLQERAESERLLVSMALNGLNRGMAEGSGERVWPKQRLLEFKVQTECL